MPLCSSVLHLSIHTFAIIMTVTDRGLELRTSNKAEVEAYFPEERPGWKGYIEWEVADF